MVRAGARVRPLPAAGPLASAPSRQGRSLSSRAGRGSRERLRPTSRAATPPRPGPAPPAPPLLRPSAGGPGGRRGRGAEAAAPRSTQLSGVCPALDACPRSDPIRALSGEYRPGGTDVPGKERRPPSSRRQTARASAEARGAATGWVEAGEGPGENRGRTGSWGLTSPPCLQPVPRGGQGSGTGNGSPRLSASAVHAAGESSQRLCGPRWESSSRL